MRRDALMNCRQDTAEPIAKNQCGALHWAIPNRRCCHSGLSARFRGAVLATKGSILAGWDSNCFFLIYMKTDRSDIINITFLIQ